MGPFMVEIVFCRVTRRGRKKGKGLNKAAMEASKNNVSGPGSFIPKDDVIKVTLDLSDNGPVFSAMDEMMMKMMEDEGSDFVFKFSLNTLRFSLTRKTDTKAEQLQTTCKSIQKYPFSNSGINKVAMVKNALLSMSF